MLGCIPARGGWDRSAVEARHPQLGALPRHRLGDLAPFFWTEREALVLFACHWGSDRVVPVWHEASEGALGGIDEAALLRRALAVLEAGGLGLRFEAARVPAGADAASGTREGITIRFVAGGSTAGEGVVGTGDAVADCRLGADHAHDRLDAQLVRASVRVASTQLDVLGRPVVLAEVDVFAAVLHELGHALGFASHVAAGESLMRKSVSDVRRVGRRAWRGEPTPLPNLRALYALPSGAVLGRFAVDPDQTRSARLLAEAARGLGFEGPFARAGDRSGELFWRGHAGNRYALIAPRTRWPESFVLIPNTAARRALRREEVTP